jgi:hypothetical protein
MLMQRAPTMNGNGAAKRRPKLEQDPWLVGVSALEEFAKFPAANPVSPAHPPNPMVQPNGFPVVIQQFRTQGQNG